MERSAEDEPADHRIEHRDNRGKRRGKVKTTAKSWVTRGWRGGRPVISLIRACCSLTVESTQSADTGAQTSANSPMI